MDVENGSGAPADFTGMQIIRRQDPYHCPGSWEVTWSVEQLLLLGKQTSFPDHRAKAASCRARETAKQLGYASSQLYSSFMQNADAAVKSAANPLQWVPGGYKH